MSDPYYDENAEEHLRRVRQEARRLIRAKGKLIKRGIDVGAYRAENHRFSILHHTPFNKAKPEASRYWGVDELSYALLISHHQKIFINFTWDEDRLFYAFWPDLDPRWARKFLRDARKIEDWGPRVMDRSNFWSARARVRR